MQRWQPLCEMSGADFHRSAPDVISGDRDRRDRGSGRHLPPGRWTGRAVLQRRTGERPEPMADEVRPELRARVRGGAAHRNVRGGRPSGSSAIAFRSLPEDPGKDHRTTKSRAPTALILAVVVIAHVATVNLKMTTILKKSGQLCRSRDFYVIPEIRAYVRASENLGT